MSVRHRAVFPVMILGLLGDMRGDLGSERADNGCDKMVSGLKEPD